MSDERKPLTEPFYCSFCTKSQNDAFLLIAAPTAFICDECVDLCTNLVAERRRKRLDNMLDAEIGS